MNPLVYLLLGLVLGALIGSLFGWLMALRRQAAHPADARVENELREQLLQRTTEISKLRGQLAETITACATAEARNAAAERLLGDQRQLQEQHLAEAKAAQEKALTDLREAFKALSADALKQTQPEFLRLANETFAKFQESAKGDLAARQEAIASVVKPLEEQLRTYQQRLQQSEATQSGALGEVKKHLETLAVQSQS